MDPHAAAPTTPASPAAHAPPAAPAAPAAPDDAVATVRFVWRGRGVELRDVPPTLTVLDWLREDRGARGTKEGCAEGDCGACAVVLAEPDDAAPGAGAPARLRWRAVNACIRFVASLDGCALFTVEDLRAPDGSLHPAQQAMVDCHGSQCGFCTPGFVMSMFALYNEHEARPVSRAQAKAALSGNLCRCTGYRPILQAAEQMSAYPPRLPDEAALAARLAALRDDRMRRIESADGVTLRPARLDDLLAARRDRPDAQVLAGGTDVGLWVNKQHRRFAAILDLSGVRALQRIEPRGDGLAIGAAVRLHEAYARLVADRPQLAGFADRFASLPVRNSGTLGGNVANGSPIGDSMPLLIALGAAVELARMDGAPGSGAGAIRVRTLALEDFYLGYRRTALAADELVTHVLVPGAPDAHELLRAYKVSKRFDQDISAVCVAIRLRVVDGRVAEARIGVGGMAAVPARARATEAVLLGREWTEQAARDAADRLRAEFAPIDDLRASGAYRREVAGNLLHRFWLDSQGVATDLEALPT